MPKPKDHSICQLTSGHSLDDERILHRFARSAAELGYESTIAGPDDGSFSFCGVSFVPCPKTHGKPTFSQRWLSPLNLLLWSFRNRKDVYQIHDPDMLLTGLFLRFLGRHVIYDVHDDYEASFETRLKSRPLLHPWFPAAWWQFEKLAARFFSKVSVADRHLAEKFAFCNPETFGNFPRSDFAPRPAEPNGDTFNVLYVGGVTRERGLGVALDAIRQLSSQEIRLHIVGACRDQGLKEQLESESRVILHGRVTWTDLPRFFSEAHVGLALYQPLPAFLYYPGENAVKIIEYMAYGIPVITSNFKGLDRFVTRYDIGATVDPTDPVAVRDCLEHLHYNHEVRRKFGRNARAAFQSQFNWDAQVERLDALYGGLAGS